MENRIKEQIGSIISAIGDGASIGLTRGAMRAYDDWMRTLDATVEDYPERMQALITRLPQHILRVAGLYALSSLYADVDTDLMMRAINLGDFAKATILKLGEMLTPDRVARLVKLLRQKLLAAPNYTMSIQDILRNMNISWKTLDPAAKSMGEAGEVTLVIEPSGPGGRVRKWFKLSEVPASTRRAAAVPVEAEAGIDYPLEE
jgi:hypothetical protein